MIDSIQGNTHQVYTGTALLVYDSKGKRRVVNHAVETKVMVHRMTPEEILTAVTINPACGIGRGETVGTLEAGKQADLVIWNAPNMEMLCYRFGSNMALATIKKGILV